MCSLIETEPELWVEHWHMLLVAWIAALEESIFLYLNAESESSGFVALWPGEGMEMEGLVTAPCPIVEMKNVEMLIKLFLEDCGR